MVAKCEPHCRSYLFLSSLDNQGDQELCDATFNIVGLLRLVLFRSPRLAVDLPLASHRFNRYHSLDCAYARVYRDIYVYLYTFIY